MKRLNSREGYDLYAAGYRKDYPHLDSFMDGAESAAWYRAFEALLSDHERVTALDAGCGDGRTLGRWVRGIAKRELADRVEFHGADVSAKMLEAARGRITGPRWHVLDLASPDAVASWSNQFGPADLISAFFVVVHFEKLKTFFTAVQALLAEGGRLVMNTIPQPSAPQLRAGGKPLVIASWDHTAEEVITAGETAGFTLERQEDFHDKDELVSTLLEWKK